MSSDIKTQLAHKLRVMEPFLSAQDKTDVARKLNKHTNTIHNYLRGDIGDEKFARQLIEAFTVILNRQIKRIKAITESNAA